MIAPNCTISSSRKFLGRGLQHATIYLWSYRLNFEFDFDEGVAQRSRHAPIMAPLASPLIPGLFYSFHFHIYIGFLFSLKSCMPLVANKLSEVVLQKTADKLTAMMPSTPSNCISRTPSNTGSNVTMLQVLRRILRRISTVIRMLPVRVLCRILHRISTMFPKLSGRILHRILRRISTMLRVLPVRVPRRILHRISTMFPKLSGRVLRRILRRIGFPVGYKLPKQATLTPDVIKCSEWDGYGVSILKTLLYSCFLDMTKSNKLHIYVVTSSKL